MLLSLRIQIEFLFIFSFFWTPRKTKQGTEALRGWFHRLTQVEDHFREGFLKMAAFFFSFFLLLSMRIFFFQFFFGWWWWFKERGNTFPWLPWYSFSMFLHLVCLSPDTLLCVRPDPLRALKSHLCLGLSAWWSMMGSPVWSKRYLARTTHFKVLTLEVSRGKTPPMGCLNHLWTRQSWWALSGHSGKCSVNF